MILTELKNRIINNSEFQEQKNRLYKLSLAKSIGMELKDLELNDKEICQLVESASILADVDDTKMRMLAYRIITELYHICSDTHDGLYNILYIILTKLGNFPAIKMFNGEYNLPEGIPTSLCYSLLGHKESNTVNSVLSKELVLTDFQTDLWKTLNTGQSVAISAPTSAGKSFIIKEYILSQLVNNEEICVIYIVPTRALINQVQTEFQNMVEKANIPDLFISTIPNLPEDLIAKKKLFILTQERLELLINPNSDLYADIIVIDEAHLISSGARGIKLETVIEKIQKRKKPQYIFAAPYITNPDIFKIIFNISNFDVPKKPEATVAQNIIMVDTNPILPRKLSIKSYNEGNIENIGTLESNLDLSSEKDYLANIAYLLGSNEQSIVYATGKASAEDIALKISYHMNPENLNKKKLKELSELIKYHVHEHYILAKTVESGVGFHYGTMPSIIRKSIENAFENGDLKFLVCTPTLLHGVNLPAKNMFILNPTTGRNIYAKKEDNTHRDIPMNSFDFWNLAGRAGRLGKEFCGNIYIINYDGWLAKPLEEGKTKTVDSSINNVIKEHMNDLIRYMRNETSKLDNETDIEAAAVKLFNDYRNGCLDDTLLKSPIQNDTESKKSIKTLVKEIAETITLPREITETNNTISPNKQQSLYDYLYKNITKKGVERYVPIHPLSEFDISRESLKFTFARALMHIKGFNRNVAFSVATPLSATALLWMKGVPLPQLIQNAYDYKKTKTKRGQPNIAVVIRDTLETIEQDVRFEYVNLTSCYISILKQVLVDLNLIDYIESIPNLPLFLEMGAASKTTLNLLSLGLSRLSASIIREKIPSSNMSEQEIKSWLVRFPPESIGLPEHVIKEIKTLKIA